MPKRTIQIDHEEHFGARLAKLRNESGFSQRVLAREMGISQRMIAYYEKETTHPPITLRNSLHNKSDSLINLLFKQ